MQNSPAVEGPSRPRRPSLWEALVPLAALALLLGVGFGVLRYPVEVLLLGAAAVAGAVGYRLGYRWPAMEEGIVRSLSTAMPAILVLVSVGALIAS